MFPAYAVSNGILRDNQRVLISIHVLLKIIKEKIIKIHVSCFKQYLM
jgi:hypothetical protein